MTAEMRFSAKFLYERNTKKASGNGRTGDMPTWWSPEAAIGRGGLSPLAHPCPASASSLAGANGVRGIGRTTVVSATAEAPGSSGIQ